MIRLPHTNDLDIFLLKITFKYFFCAFGMDKDGYLGSGENSLLMFWRGRWGGLLACNI